MTDSTQAQDNKQNTLTPENLTPEQEKHLLSQFQKLNTPTQQVLLTMMKASAENNVALMRTCQQVLPEDQRHLFDKAIAQAEKNTGGCNTNTETMTGHRTALLIEGLVNQLDAILSAADVLAGEPDTPKDIGRTHELIALALDKVKEIQPLTLRLNTQESLQPTLSNSTPPTAPAIELEHQIDESLSRLLALVCVARSEDYTTYNADLQGDYMAVCEKLTDGVIADFQSLKALTRQQSKDGAA